ncbi:hypothetical protein NBRC116594_25060 [Shimia sp. NS0008-38b]|uniref:winged helix domain-containing protein n=1 Tax=Shimia sp. NS0008-38b TaxID=3127653 RepID=UPI003101DB07
MTTQQWNQKGFAIILTDGREIDVFVSGRNRWALECLIEAGDVGCSSLDYPAVRWSAYIHNLRNMGVEIETRHEPHKGDFPGTHARYVLKCLALSIGGAK